MNELTYPAIIDGLAFLDYRSRDEISVHGLGDVARCPAYYRFRKDNPNPPTPAMRLGTLIDTRIFEPERISKDWALIPKEAPERPALRSVNAKKPRPEIIEAHAFWQKYDAENIGKEMVDSGEIAKLDAIRESVFAHTDASALLTVRDGARIQPSMIWRDKLTGVACRGRPDQIHPRGIIIDLKSAEDASKDAFSRASWNFRYDAQAAFYCDGYEQIFGKPPLGFVFIVVEKEPPYFVVCYMASDKMIARGRKRYQHDIEIYAECLRKNEWPAYPAGITPLDLPSWADKD